jgi:hypothetical protein
LARCQGRMYVLARCQGNEMNCISLMFCEEEYYV